MDFGSGEGGKGRLWREHIVTQVSVSLEKPGFEKREKVCKSFLKLPNDDFFTQSWPFSALMKKVPNCIWAAKKIKKIKWPMESLVFFFIKLELKLAPPTTGKRSQSYFPKNHESCKWESIVANFSRRKVQSALSRNRTWLISIACRTLIWKTLFFPCQTSSIEFARVLNTEQCYLWFP